MSFEDREEEEGDGGFSPVRILSALRRRWIVIAAGTVIATLISAAIAFSLPNRYEAAATIQLDPRKKNVSNVEEVLSEMNMSTATIESEVEVIRSRKIVLQVIDRLNLRNDEEFAGTGLPAPRSAPNSNVGEPAATTTEPEASSDPTAPRRDLVANAFSSRLSVGRVRNTLLIEVRFTSTDPEKAALIVNTVAQVYVDEQLSAKASVAKHATELLDDRLDSLRRKVSEAERKVEKYKAEQNIFASEGQILSEKELARMMEQTVTARNKTAETRARYERARQLLRSGRSASDIADVLSSHTVRLLKEKVADASRRRAELATRYGDRHPRMIKVRAELADARAQLDREVSALIANLENQFQEASSRERELIAGLNEKKQEETERRTANVRLNELEREAETSRQIYQVLLSRFKQNTATQTLQLPDARVVEFADTPLYPAAPKRKQMVILAAAGSLAISLALVLALEFATPGIGRPEEAEGLLALEHISSLPRLDGIAGDNHDPLLASRLMIAAPASAFAESIRALRREIDVRQDHPGPRIILIAASLPGEGASVVASNLAHYYAQTGERVLLLDADMRCSNLSRQLAPGRRAGLAEALSGNIAPEQAILRDQLTNLHFMPARGGGPMPTGQSELLNSPSLPAVLGHLKQQFDTIIVDAPPLLPVIDTRVLADFADQIAFVIAWRKTPKQLARKALKLLEVNAERICGVVVNQVARDILADDQGVDSIDDPGADLIAQSRQRQPVAAA
ncbi:MAG: polysaccharide biosynthesis tyrosine autokinase [Alphaproteobacteria bacterium]|nr:polysaccharide biosynthesis tyrosine autokinase [Alphaproteobacteria bacterium]